jgi:hypothetical protein
MVTPSIESILDNVWEEAEGELDVGNLKAYYNVRPQMSKEEWKKQWMKKVFKTNDFVQCPNGEILMPDLGIY